ncbi:MAG: SufS family cysteine desulfurase [Planctomycetota bacterium]
MNIANLRAEFPGLSEEIDGKRFAYLDTCATAQKPLAVIERMDRFLRSEYGTVHRGMYQRSVRSTEAYEQARASVAKLLNAPKPDNVVYTSGSTDAINLVAWSWGRANLKAGDAVLISAMEHHANIVPWHITRELFGFELRVCPIHDDGSLDLEAFDRLLDDTVKLVSMAHVSNVLGTVNPVDDIIKRAHAVGAKVLIDAAQSVPHGLVDVQAMDCDFLVCSSHKVYGPTGIGALYGKPELLAAMPPWRGGGDMIDRVTFEGSTYGKPPLRFEAGTPAIVEAIGFAAAAEWFLSLDQQALHRHEHELYRYCEERLADVPGLQRIGCAPERAGAISFVMDEAHPSDIANILDMQGVAIRAGHHCAQPLMQRYGIGATARISFGCYSNKEDVDQAITGLHKAAKLFGLEG